MRDPIRRRSQRIELGGLVLKYFTNSSKCPALTFSRPGIDRFQPNRITQRRTRRAWAMAQVDRCPPESLAQSRRCAQSATRERYPASGVDTPANALARAL